MSVSDTTTEKIYEFVRSFGRIGTSMRDVQRMLQKSDTTVYDGLKRLCDLGKVERIHGLRRVDGKLRQGDVYRIKTE